MQEYYPLIGGAIYAAILGLVALWWLRSERAEARARRQEHDGENPHAENRHAVAGHGSL